MNRMQTRTSYWHENELNHAQLRKSSPSKSQNQIFRPKPKIITPLKMFPLKPVTIGHRICVQFGKFYLTVAKSLDFEILASLSKNRGETCTLLVLDS